MSDADCILRGIPAAPGRSLGKIRYLNDSSAHRNTFNLGEMLCGFDPKEELARFERAVKVASASVLRSIERLASEKQNVISAVLGSYQLMLEDPELRQGVKNILESSNCSAEVAVSQQIATWVSQLASVEDNYLAERGRDIAHIGELLLRRLSSEATEEQLKELSPELKAGERVVLVADDISPATLCFLDTTRLAGLITRGGSPHSHAAILAGALGIPAICCLEQGFDDLLPGRSIELDGDTGQVKLLSETAINASGSFVPETEADNSFDAASVEELWKGLPVDFQARFSLSSGLGKLKFDHVLDEPAVFSDKKKQGSADYGLIRTESWLLQRSELPSEEEQFNCYLDFCREHPGARLNFRLFDLGSDKRHPMMPLVQEKNPALGIRGLALGIEVPQFYLEQLRALGRVATLVRQEAQTEVRILVPMVLDRLQWSKFLLLFDEAWGSLASTGVPPALGCMIETPAMALQLERPLERCEFLSIGSNDLAMYALGVDRERHWRTSLDRGFHPALWKLLLKIQQDLALWQMAPSLCGRLASEPVACQALLALGFKELVLEGKAVSSIAERLGHETLGTILNASGKVLDIIGNSDSSEELYQKLDLLFTRAAS